MMKKAPFSAFLYSLVCVLGLSMAPVQADVRVVTSIKPVHSLVSAVMEGVGMPDLLIDGTASPHSYALRPSQARALQNADVIFWIGQELEAFLEKPVETTAHGALSVPLLDTDGLHLLEFREEHHDHHDHGDEHKHEEEHKEGHKDEDHKHHDDEHKDHAEHKDHVGHDKEHGDHDEHGNFDPHVWLDPANARVMVNAIAAVLSKADPGNTGIYQRNAAKTVAALDQLIADTAKSLGTMGDGKYVVFHDAYQYFEERFGLKSSGVIAVNPEVLPGAAHLSELKQRIATMGVSCVFAEPQFKRKLIDLVTEGTAAKSAILDPLGSAIPAGADMYFVLINDMASAMRGCLS